MTVDAAFPIPIPAPAEIDIAPVEPFKLETTDALAAGAGTEIVTDPAPTPTDAMPAPENWRLVPNVPRELEVVLPSADIVPVCRDCDAEIVSVERLEDSETIPDATRLTLELDPLSEKFVAAGTVGPAIDMTLAPVANVIFAPAASNKLPVDVAVPTPSAAT